MTIFMCGSSDCFLISTQSINCKYFFLISSKKIDCGYSLVPTPYKKVPTQVLELKYHYVNVSVLIKFSKKASVFTLITISSP